MSRWREIAERETAERNCGLLVTRFELAWTTHQLKGKELAAGHRSSWAQAKHSSATRLPQVVHMSLSPVVDCIPDPEDPFKKSGPFLVYCSARFPSGDKVAGCFG